MPPVRAMNRWMDLVEHPTAAAALAKASPSETRRWISTWSPWLNRLPWFARRRCISPPPEPVARIIAEMLRRSLETAQSIRAALTEYALGQAGMSTVVGQYRRYPRIFRETIFEVLTLVDGKPRERLAHVAEQLGIANRWLQRVRSGVVRRRLAAVRAIGFIPTLRTRRALRRALDDDDVDVQLAAAHALVRHGHPARPGARVGVRGSALALGPSHSRPGDERVGGGSREASHPDRADIARTGCGWWPCSNFVKLWQVRLTPDTVTPLHEHPDPRVRALAVATLPQVDGLGDLVSSLERGLSDEADEVRAAAASVVAE